MCTAPHAPTFASIVVVLLVGRSAAAQNEAPVPSATAAPTPTIMTPADLVADKPSASALPVVTLAVLERGAVERQPQVRIARAQTRAEEGVVEQVRSPFFPQLTATAQYSYGNSVRVSNAANATQTGTEGFWNFGLSGSQLIYDFGQTAGRFDAARDQVDADRATEKATQFQILVTVRNAYFTARADKELVGVAEETLSDQARHLAQVQGFVQVGTQPPIALAQQRAAVASARVALITAQNNYETAKAELNQAAGLRRDTEYDVGDEVLGPVFDEEQPLDPLLGKALAARPEIASFVKQRNAQSDTISAAKGGYGPTLSAFGNASEIGTTLDNLQPLWSVGALVSWPFFQGGLTAGQVRQAEATLSNLDAQEELEMLQIQLQVDTARLAVRAAKGTIGAAEEAESSAHEQLRLAEQRYATGVGSIIELNDAQVAYTAAAAELVQARYQLASARAQLLAALGRT
jgi:outer membrane protein